MGRTNFSLMFVLLNFFLSTSNTKQKKSPLGIVISMEVLPFCGAWILLRIWNLFSKKKKSPLYKVGTVRII